MITALQTGDVPAAKQVVQMSDVVLHKNKCAENRRRMAVIVPFQRVGKPRYAIVAEVDNRMVDHLSALHRPCAYLRQVVVCNGNCIKPGQIGCGVEQVLADRRYTIMTEVHRLKLRQVIKQTVL